MKRAAPPTKPSAPAKAPAKSGGTASLPAPSAGEPVKYKFSPEDAEAQAAELIPADVQAGLADGQWKERLGAAEKLWLGLRKAMRPMWKARSSSAISARRQGGMRRTSR
jgi:hypothetical protein